MQQLWEACAGQWYQTLPEDQVISSLYPNIIIYPNTMPI